MNDIASVTKVCRAEEAGQRPPSKIFISYSHEDEGWLNYVRSHLRPAEVAGELDLWDDRKLMGGDDWEAEIAKALAECRVCILLVSHHSLTSDYIDRVEMKTALEHAKSQGVRIYPIFVSETYVPKNHWLRKFNWRPKDGQPLQDLFENTGERGKAMVAIVREIVELAAPSGEKQGEGEKGPFGAIPELPKERGKHSGLRAIVAASKESLEKLNDDIHVLVQCKELHDCLHELQLNHYRQVLEHACDIETSQQARDQLQHDLIELTKLCLRLRASAELLPKIGADRAHVMRWVQQLEEGIPKLKHALSERKAELALPAFSPFRNVIVYEQNRVNAVLHRLVEELQLEELLSMLSTVTSTKSVSKAFADELEKDIISLREIKQLLDERVIEHDSWQQIERDFWNAEELIEEKTSDSVQEFKKAFWGSIKENVNRIAENQKQDEWAQSSKNYEDQIEVILTQNFDSPESAESLRSTFKIFRENALYHFFEVNLDLKMQCNKILSLRETLEELLKPEELLREEA